MPDAQRTFTQDEHLALLTDRVQRETAELTVERDALKTQTAELQQRIDVLEAEKAQALTERDAISNEFEAYKAELARQAEIAERSESRVNAVREAVPHLGDDYFTAERSARWAAMDDDAFAALLADLTPVAPVVKAADEVSTKAPRETAAFSQGTAPTSSTGSVKQLLAAVRGA